MAVALLFPILLLSEEFILHFLSTVFRYIVFPIVTGACAESRNMLENKYE